MAKKIQSFSKYSKSLKRAQKCSKLLKMLKITRRGLKKLEIDKNNIEYSILL